MIPLTAKTLKGNWASVLLPLNEDDSIDYDLLEEEIVRLIESGVNGIYCNGTAGEFYNQTEDEFDRLAELLATKCTTANTPFQIGVCHMSPLISLNRLRRTRELNPGAFQVIMPDWYPTTHDERICFLQKMADAAEGIGLVLYNPGHAKIKLSPADIAALADVIPQIIGVKGTWHEDMKTLSSKLAVFVPGHELATDISQGASGSYSNVACLNPVAAQRWYELMLTDIDSALELEQRIQSFIVGHIVPYITRQRYSDQAVDKFMAFIGGWTELSGRLRWPYKSIPEAEAIRLRPVAMDLLPEFFVRDFSVSGRSQGEPAMDDDNGGLGK